MFLEGIAPYMKNSIILKPISYVKGNVYLPGSKSISNRILLLSAMAQGITKIKNLLKSEDTGYMLSILKLIGIKFKLFNNSTLCIIEGNINVFKNNSFKTLFVGNAGTVMRPLIAIFSAAKNDIELTGIQRMKERPINHLVDALRQGGADISYKEKENYPPIYLKGGFVGGNIQIQGNISSQFLTSLLMAAPLAKKNTIITVEGSLVSKPYIDITLNLMQQFKIQFNNNNYKSFEIPGNQIYSSPIDFMVEGDASSGSYFLAAAAIKGKTVKVFGIGKNSIQGDSYFAEILKKAGAIIDIQENYIACTKGKLHSLDLDMNAIPDVAMTFAIVALFAIGRTNIRNIYNWRVKETDRLSAMAMELQKIGAIVHEGKDFISITPPKKFYPAIINTYNDHRMAMCFSLISLADIPITILNPKCTIKTFPKYFETLSSICIYKK